jgi:hypothetical protein
VALVLEEEEVDEFLEVPAAHDLPRSDLTFCQTKRSVNFGGTATPKTSKLYIFLIYISDVTKSDQSTPATLRKSKNAFDEETKHF